MKRLGIIQPGKIGDIIICLPIAKWYADKGYDVIWPVDRNIIRNFLAYVDYVHFIAIDFNCQEAHQVCRNMLCNTIIDIAFTIPGSSGYNDNCYKVNWKYSFDEFKYELAGVPFEEKWKLQLKRSSIKDAVFPSKIGLDESKPYAVIQTHSSDCSRNIDWKNESLQPVYAGPATDSVFDWVPVLQKAQQHVLIESCFSNLVDQLGIVVPKQRLLLKNGYYGDKLDDGALRGVPRLKLDWEKL